MAPPNISRDIRKAAKGWKDRIAILVYELNYRYDTNAHGYRYIGIRSKVTNRILCLIIFPTLCYNHLGILVHR